VGGKTGIDPTATSNIVADFVLPSSDGSVPGSVTAGAYEIAATADNWGVDAIALCAKRVPVGNNVKDKPRVQPDSCGTESHASAVSLPLRDL